MAELTFALRSVTKRLGGATVLAAIDLEVEGEHTLALVGPSGSGKSTLLRLMNGLLRPDAGTVSFEDTVLSRSNVLGLRRRMGYVIQEGGLFPHLTARDNVAIQARYLRWPRERTDSRIDTLVELARFEASCLDRYPVELSGGQRQRVSLMRALMLDPDVLLLDEPLGALDPMIRSELQVDLRRVFRALGKTVVLVTHDLAEAVYFADRLALIDRGRIVQAGRFEDFVERPATSFVSRFLEAQRFLHYTGDRRRS